MALHRAGSDRVPKLELSALLPQNNVFRFHSGSRAKHSIGKELPDREK